MVPGLQESSILVTGGSGYLGQFVVQQFAALGCKVGTLSTAWVVNCTEAEVHID